MISVIVPAKNASATLEACLQSLAAQRELESDYEIIVVDDGSTDGTAEVAGRYEVRLIRQESQGPAAARNAGAQAASGRLLAFTDADCEPAPMWLHHLQRAFKDRRVAGANGTYGTTQTGLVPRFVQQEYAFKYDRMSRLASIDFIDTYSAAYRREIFLANDGFDPAFPVPSVEDQEFSFRLARKGYRMVFVPEAKVFHRHDHHLPDYLRRKFGIGYWKAYMLGWLPEKALSDSHTPPWQRWQIVTLGLAAATSLLVIGWPGLWWLPAASLALFTLSCLPILSWIARNDPGLLPAAPVMLLARAAALGAGLIAGFAAPPARRPRGAQGLTLGQRAIKRALDLVVASIGLILSAPVMLLAAAAIKLAGGGPAFFSQDRAGEHGKRFRIYKLRSMVVGAEKQVGRVLASNPLSGPVFKIPNDPRVTRVGGFLRRWSLDELPQLWNVLRGDMSLVGPRPEELWVVDRYSDQQRARLAFKPGMTGPMQVRGRGELDMQARLVLELDYIRNYSFWQDLKILAQTIPSVLSGRGAS